MGLVAIILAVVAACGVGTWWQGRTLAGARRERERALTAEAAARRAANLAAADLRDCAMRVLGHLEQLSTGPAQNPQASGAVASLRHLMGLVDDLQDQGVSNVAPRALRVEALPLDTAVRDAIAAVSATLGPGRRNWRVAPALAERALLADRRALSQVLVRVLGNAARHSAAADWIEVGLQICGDGVEVTVDDEGSGLCAPDRTALPGRLDSRGLGLGLSLARTLMEAHGGTLSVDSAARVGTRVVLGFPAKLVAGPATGEGDLASEAGGLEAGHG